MEVTCHLLPPRSFRSGFTGFPTTLCEARQIERRTGAVVPGVRGGRPAGGPRSDLVLSSARSERRRFGIRVGQSFWDRPTEHAHAPVHRRAHRGHGRRRAPLLTRHPSSGFLLQAPTPTDSTEPHGAAVLSCGQHAEAFPMVPGPLPRSRPLSAPSSHVSEFFPIPSFQLF